MEDKTLIEVDKKLLLKTLKDRFEKNIHRHPDTDWLTVETILQANKNILWTIHQMEITDGEPDLIILNNKLVYCDCSLESPKGRRSLCYDKQAWDKRKENKPRDNVLDFANKIGIQILNEEEYFQLQSIDDFDLKTSSWLSTPTHIRNKNGAIFGDKRYGRAFIYHNGAESYYSSRGFRGFVILIYSRSTQVCLNKLEVYDLT